MQDGNNEVRLFLSGKVEDVVMIAAGNSHLRILIRKRTGKRRSRRDLGKHSVKRLDVAVSLLFAPSLNRVEPDAPNIGFRGGG